jgi:hypothetical protein
MVKDTFCFTLLCLCHFVGPLCGVCDTDVYVFVVMVLYPGRQEGAVAYQGSSGRHHLH